MLDLNFVNPSRSCKGKNHVSISYGNMKLVSNPLETMFIIWNLPYKITCPFRTPHCEALCYAEKAETQYPDAKPARFRNLEATRSPLFVDFVVAMLHYLAKRPKYANAPEFVVRIHESGDFYNKAYAEKWKEIARRCKDIPNLKFMAYTKSLIYFEDGYPENMVIRGSIWDDTKPEQLELMEKMDVPTYTVVEQEEFDKLPEESKCHCKDCGHCRKCWNKDIKHICNVKH